MPWQTISKQIEAATGEPFKVVSTHPLSGGDINTAFLLKGDRKSYFIKLNKAELSLRQSGHVHEFEKYLDVNGVLETATKKFEEAKEKKKKSKTKGLEKFLDADELDIPREL